VDQENWKGSSGGPYRYSGETQAQFAAVYGVSEATMYRALL